MNKAESGEVERTLLHCGNVWVVFICGRAESTYQIDDAVLIAISGVLDSPDWHVTLRGIVLVLNFGYNEVREEALGSVLGEENCLNGSLNRTCTRVDGF
jgi:hypothetical protein